MTPKHTHGPWKLEDNPVAPCQLTGDGGIHIADIYMTDFPFGEANARLIAAAPELAEALQAILLWAGKDKRRCKIPFEEQMASLNRAYKVLADVEGRQ